MKFISITIAFNVLLGIVNIGISHAAENKNEQAVQSSTTTQVPAATSKPKTIIKDSELCKKCSCDTEIFQIDCTNKSMTTLFTADEWQTLQNGDVFFEIIKMNHNEISYIPALPSYPVKSLYLSFNKVINISVGAFQNLTQLTVLDFSNNKLTSKSLRPDVFKGMYATDKYEPLINLKSLDLSYNNIHTLNNDLFEHLPNLETLILSKNTFHVIDIPTTVAISSLNSLKTLDISYMELRELPDTIFHSLSDLETLVLTGNLFNIVPDALTRAKHLKKLILDENPLNDFDRSNVFSSLGGLEYLSISYLPEVKKIGPGALSDFQNLTTLVAINNPKLSHIHELAFRRNTTSPDYFDYPPLKKLLLHNNNLTAINRNWVIRWDKIIDLDLRFNPWTCDCTNNWFIHSLIKQINDTAPPLTRDVKCATPEIWKNKLILQLSDNKNELLCEDTTHQEGNSLIFVGILVGILIGIPLTIAGLFIYRNNCFGLLNRRTATANRSLYNRASFADEFHI